MSSVAQLAAARWWAHDAVVRHGEHRIHVLRAIERSILEHAIRISEVAEMRDRILFQYGPPDLSEPFNQKLSLKLLQAI